LTLIFFVGLLFFPWRSNIHAPGLLRSEQQALVYTPLPARLTELRQSGLVKAGEVLATLDSPDARSRANQSAAVAQALALQLDQTIGRVDGQETRASIQEQLGERLAEVSAQTAELARLALRAQFDGLWTDLDPLMGQEVWINGTQPLGLLIDPKQFVIEALAEQTDVERLKPGNAVRFYQRGTGQAPLIGRIVSVDRTRTQVLPHAMLATDHGGRLATTQGNPDSAVGAEALSKQAKANGLVPRDSLYRVRIALEPGSRPQLQRAVLSGTAVIEGEPRSIGMEWFKTVAAVLVRESGF
jgi:putative peptide zinc metalloprotease protein